MKKDNKKMKSLPDPKYIQPHDSNAVFEKLKEEMSVSPGILQQLREKGVPTIKPMTVKELEEMLLEIFNKKKMKTAKEKFKVPFGECLVQTSEEKDGTKLSWIFNPAIDNDYVALKIYEDHNDLELVAVTKTWEQSIADSTDEFERKLTNQNYFIRDVYLWLGTDILYNDSLIREPIQRIHLLNAIIHNYNMNIEPINIIEAQLHFSKQKEDNYKGMTTIEAIKYINEYARELPRTIVHYQEDLDESLFYRITTQTKYKKISKDETVTRNTLLEIGDNEKLEIYVKNEEAKVMLIEMKIDISILTQELIEHLFAITNPEIL